MALSANTVWEVRGQTGSDTNGGGFVAGASGTDWSQQASPKYSVTDGVTAGTTTITSATAAWGTDIVGNIVYVQGGTGSITAGWYQVTARTNSTTITVDRSTGLTSGTGVTLHIGGALATLAQLATNMVTANKAWVKADGTYTLTAGVTFATANASASSGSGPNWLTGYSTTRGDKGQPSIVLSTNTGLTALTFSNSGWRIENLSINCSSLGTSKGINFAGSATTITNCKVSNFTIVGITSTGGTIGNMIFSCEITGGTSAATAGIILYYEDNNVYYSYVHDNACTGVQMWRGNICAYNLITNNTGASSDGVMTQQNGAGANLFSNTIYGNGRHGVNSAGTGATDLLVKNNILANNGGYGLQLSSSASIPAWPEYDGNAFFSNASGSRSNMDNTTTLTYQDHPYTNIHDVICTTTPFTNAAGGDFSLNTSATGGALCRGTGSPGTLPGVSQTSYTDFGALGSRPQHAFQAVTMEGGF